MIIRADGGLLNTKKGRIDLASGHLMRMLNFARAWLAESGIVTLLLHDSCQGMDWVLNSYSEAGCDINFVVSPTAADSVDAEFLFKFAQNGNADFIYLDGYHFDSDYQKALRRLGIPIALQADDSKNGPFFADLIVGSHLNAPNLDFDMAVKTELLLGPKYAFLNEKFAKVGQREKLVPQVAKSLLLTFGGSDPFSDSQNYLRAFLSPELGNLTKTWLKGLEIRLIIGSAHRFKNEIVDLADQLKKEGVKVLLLTEVKDMAEEMKAVDLAVSPPGGTILELMCIGVPTCLQVIHPVQIPIAELLVKTGVCEMLGNSVSSDACRVEFASKVHSLALNQKKRQLMSERGRELVDGNGAERVIEQVALLLNSSQKS